MNENDTWYKCTVCGREGTVGRCCGDDTRIPLNDKAKKRSTKIKENKINYLSGILPTGYKIVKTETTHNSGYMVRIAKAILSQIAKATSYIRKRCTTLTEV